MKTKLFIEIARAFIDAAAECRDSRGQSNTVYVHTVCEWAEILTRRDFAWVRPDTLDRGIRLGKRRLMLGQ